MRWRAGSVVVVLVVAGLVPTATADVRQEDRTVGGALFGEQVLADVDGMYSTRAAAIADVTGDGAADLVAASDGPDDVLLVFRWEDGALVLDSSTPTEGYPLETLAVGDVLSSAGPEIVVGYQGTMAIFTTATGVPVHDETRAAPARALQIGDVDDDGRADVVSTPVNDPVLVVQRQADDGTLEPPVEIPLPVDTNRDLELGDLDDDGRTDVVAMSVGEAAITVLYQRDEGFSDPEVHALPPTGWTSAIAVGDLTGDGRDDIVLERDQSLHLFVQQPEGGLVLERVVHGYPSARGLTTADVDGDGDLDLVTESSYSPVVAVHLQDHDGLDPQFQRYALSSQAFGPAGSPAVGDVTGDGRVDVAGPTSGSRDQQGVVTVLPSTGEAQRWPASGATDVGPGYRDAVDWVTSETDGETPASPIMTGYPDGRFRAGQAVTRAQFANALWRARGSQYADTRGVPRDVPRWARPPVAYVLRPLEDRFHQPRPAAMSTYPDGTFRPNRSISRGEAAVAVYRLYGAEDVARPERAHGYVDVPPWAERAVRWLTTSRNGADDQRPYAPPASDLLFAPGRALTRGALATWLYRIQG
jgi:hypothetical protein